MSELITNPKSEKIKRIRSYFVKKNRLQYSRAIVEGVNACEIIVNNFPDKIIEIIVLSENKTNEKNSDKMSDSSAKINKTADASKTAKSTWNMRIAEIIETAKANSIRLCFANKDVMESISDNNEGIIAVTNLSVINSESSKSGPIIICKATSDPGNAGTIIRAAAAFGVSKAIFTNNSVDCWNQKVIRSSVGAVFQLAIQIMDDVKDALDYVKSSGHTVIALDANGTESNLAKSIDKIINSQNIANQSVAFLFGNEAHGLDSEDLSQVDYIAKIDMNNPDIDSLNLAGAVHICLYEYQKYL